MELKDTYQIADILSKYFTDCLTETEQLTLDNWLNSSEINRALFNEFCTKGFFEKKHLAETSVNSQEAMLEFMERKYHANNQKNFIVRYFKYAAAAVIVIIGGLAFYHFKSPNTAQSFTTIAENITPGSKKAILTLANGKKVFLNNRITGEIKGQDITVINATDSSLQYHNSGKLQTLAYNELETPGKSEFQIILADGTKVWLNAGSKIKYPVTFATKERRVELSGEAYFEVSKNKEKPFIIEVANNSIQVLGTSFNVKAYKGDTDIYTTLVEGSVRMESPYQSLNLNPNEQGVINLKSKRIIKSSVDVALYVSWKNGRFVFDNQPLEEIMNAISRWYGIEVVFENEAARKVTFSGNLKRYESLNKIIAMLEMTEQIKFKKEGNTIYIKK